MVFTNLKKFRQLFFANIKRVWTAVGKPAPADGFDQ